METNIIYNKDCLDMDKYIDDGSISCIISSPPYNQDFARKKKWFGGTKLAYEDKRTEEEYQDFINNVYDLCVNKLKETGQMYINIKSRVRNGELFPPFWILELPFAKRMRLRSSVFWKLTGSYDRPSKRYFNNYEYIFHFSKGDNYTFHEKDLDPLWNLGHILKKEERTIHIAQFPERVPKKAILASTNVGDIVFDPFMGVATTAVAAYKENRKYIGFEIKKEYYDICLERLKKVKSQKGLGDYETF